MSIVGEATGRPEGLGFHRVNAAGADNNVIDVEAVAGQVMGDDAFRANEAVQKLPSHLLGD